MNDQAPMTDIHGLKPALPMGMDTHLLIWIALAVVAAAVIIALVWWLWRRRKKSLAPPSAPPLPAPEVEAYAALDTLAAENHADLKLFYFRLSAIVRRYVERRYDIPAAEMTTEELLPFMNRLDLEAELVRQFKDFCLRSDPIKFAGAMPDRSRLAHELAFGRDFVRRTTQVHEAALSMETTANGAAAAVEDTPGQIPTSRIETNQKFKKQITD